MERNPAATSETTFDLVVIGAGIYGTAAALEASRRGLKVLVVDRGDFGGGTTWNSFRILHGGLRYLQTLDLVRFRESVRARSWYVDEFPTLIEPLECLMPLYGQGRRRAALLRPALAANQLLRQLWSSKAETGRIPESSLVSSETVKRRFPGVRSPGLKGGAIWFDGYLPQPQRLLIEMLRRASAWGAAALNYVEATGWAMDDGQIAGVEVRDLLTGKGMTMRAGAVLNCGGPWAADIAETLVPATDVAFTPTLAFNLLLARRIDSDVTVAVEPAGGGRTYFLHPRGQTTLAGTYHVPAVRPGSLPTDQQIAAFLADLSAAVPGFEPRSEHVLRVMPGTLPAGGPGSDTPANRDLWVDHGNEGGPRGVFTLIGTKYTTAPWAAQRAIDRIADRCVQRVSGHPARGVEPDVRHVPGWEEFAQLNRDDPAGAAELVCTLIEDENVTSLDDLLLRRTDWGLVPSEYAAAADIVRRLCPELRGRSDGG
ncbi:MAG: FAD-dependent oxidoreductase [Gemmatimonadota bacterium]|nr:FAD-dependent oxidoreductase [Gemmatimonadota bacterium]MDH3428030.1 FAD-dependent oxidoreductase [Gemmatimonadota bacterium]